jgi:hypothetical protein
LSIEDFAKEVIGGLNERYNRMPEAEMKAAKNVRACNVKDEKGPSLPKEDE